MSHVFDLLGTASRLQQNDLLTVRSIARLGFSFFEKICDKNETDAVVMHNSCEKFGRFLGVL